VIPRVFAVNDREIYERTKRNDNRRRSKHRIKVKSEQVPFHAPLLEQACSKFPSLLKPRVPFPAPLLLNCAPIFGGLLAIFRTGVPLDEDGSQPPENVRWPFRRRKISLPLSPADVVRHGSLANREDLEWISSGAYFPDAFRARRRSR
jgi:hypothetical protein